MFANSSVGNTYRPDRRILDSVTALAAQITALKARTDTIPATSGVSMGSLGAVGMITMRDGRPSFEVDSGQIEITYSLGVPPETLTRVTATASAGVFLSVYDGNTLLGGGLASGVLQLNFAAAAPQNLKIVAALGGPGSPHGRYRAVLGLISGGAFLRAVYKCRSKLKTLTIQHST